LGFEEDFNMSEMEGAWETWREHWVKYAEAFAHPIQADGLVSNFVTNSAVTGAYAEAWVRWVTKNMLSHRFRISTGAVIRPSDKIRGLRRVPQCDLIVWDPSEMPAVFECGEFALVPLSATRAVIEVKRNGNREKLTEQLRKLQGGGPYPVLGVFITHREPLFDQPECRPDWLELPKYRVQPPITRLLDAGHKPDTNGVIAFIYFLAQVAGNKSELVLRNPVPKARQS
jgi:hypothetical protein